MVGSLYWKYWTDLATAVGKIADTAVRKAVRHWWL